LRNLGCNTEGFYKWWLQHIPYFKGTDSSGHYNNWWKYIVDYPSVAGSTSISTNINDSLSGVIKSTVNWITGNSLNNPTVISGKVSLNNNSKSIAESTIVTLHTSKTDTGLSSGKLSDDGKYVFVGLDSTKTYIVKAWARTADGKLYQNQPCTFTDSAFDCTVKPGHVKNLNIDIGAQGIRNILDKGQESTTAVFNKWESLPVIGPILYKYIISAFE